jgi:hypothetical protein
MKQIKKISLTGLMLIIILFSGIFLIRTFFSTERDNLPSIRITIEDPDIGDAAMELIYEDEYHRYYLTSIRSNKIMITFEDGLVISLREALDREKITITDLILNGLKVVTEPKN